MDPEVGLKLSKNSNRKIYFIFDTKILFNYEYKDFLKTSKDTLLSPKLLWHSDALLYYRRHQMDKNDFE